MLLVSVLVLVCVVLEVCVVLVNVYEVEVVMEIVRLVVVVVHW